jgi:hypothetical protein
MIIGPSSSIEMPAAVERRMLTMLECVGLDSSIAMPVQPDTILECVIDAKMKGVRQRCCECTATDLCERWLAGDQCGDNDFCPNAKVFDELKVISSPDARL